jgi:hypothetical protein
MRRETEEALVDFVSSQRTRFKAAAWLETPHPTGATREELATVAHFIDQTTFGHECPLPDWWTHKEELRTVAGRLSDHTLRELIDRTGFEPDRFAIMVDAVANKATRESDVEAVRIKTESRQRVAAFAAEGKGLKALNENLKLLGIDGEDIQRGGERPKLIDFELS